ncbi:hypothetical protein HK405_008932 [Cladochytrium tenue]|nr:hypothetical protein HK405_008932 [Cladochytrium tenue]
MKATGLVAVAPAAAGAAAIAIPPAASWASGDPAVDEAYLRDLAVQTQKLQGVIGQLQDEKAALEVELREKNNKIAILRKIEIHETRTMRTQEESEALLLAESNRRIRLEAEVNELRDALDRSRHRVFELEVVVDDLKKSNAEHDEAERRQSAEIVVFRKAHKEMEFDVDELKVNLARSSRRCEDLEKTNITLTQKNELLVQIESTLREENTALQKRLRELIDANKEVTTNYQAIKKNHELKRNEFEELATELEEAKNACQLAIATQVELTQVTKQRQEITEKAKATEILLARKEKDIADLLTKINDTVNEYEMKLERKEEQMWAMSMQMSEESSKNRNHIAIDPDFIGDIEKKWQAKEKNLQEEIERLVQAMVEKDTKIEGLVNQVTDLRKNQYQPRMERLKAIEKDIKGRMEEFALAEERLELKF